MCLITFAYRAHADYPLLVAANRDEYYARPTAGLRFWEDLPDVAAGRDLQAGGTWLGITRSGRFAAITNHRNPPTTPASPRSRGMLTLDFLAGEAGPEGFLEKLAPRAGEYAGFNLLLGDDETLWRPPSATERQRRTTACPTRAWGWSWSAPFRPSLSPCRSTGPERQPR